MMDPMMANFFGGLITGLLAGALGTLLVVVKISEKAVSEKTAVEKGAAVYRIKPGTLNEVEFVWKCDLEKEGK